MAPPSNLSLLRRYSTWLTQSKTWRANDYDDTWRRMKFLYSGKHFESGGSEDQLIVNMGFATINVIAPSVSVSNPKFTVNARKPESQPQAMFAEEVINYIWRTYQYHSQFRAAVNDWLLFGHGWMKVGYKFVTKPKVVESDDGDDGDEGIEDREDKEGNVESELEVTDDRPFAERISPFNMYVDHHAHTMDDLRWIAQRIRRPVADVRVDKRYLAKARKEVQASTQSRFTDDDVATDRSPTGARDLGFVDIIEFYDLRRQTYCVFAESQTDGFLVAPKKWPYSFGQPFLMLRNYEVPDEFYPIGELEEIESLQLELNETRTQMLNHRKRFARKYLYMEDAFDEVGVQALESDEDNTMVVVNSGQDINRVIIPMPSIGTPPDFYNQSEMIQNDIDKVSGTSDYMRGNMPEIRRTATEAAMVQDAQNSRSADKMSRVEAFLGELADRIIQLMQQYMTGDQVIRVIGGDAMPLWITYDKDYIKGEFDFEVEAGSTQPQNETFRRQSAMQMVDAMAPFVQAGVINVPELAKYVLQFGFGIKDPDKLVLATPPQGAPPEGQPPPASPEGMPPGPQAPGALPPGAPAGGGGPPPPEQAAGASPGPPPAGAGAPPGAPPGAAGPMGGGMPPGGPPPEMAGGPPPGMPPGGPPPEMGPQGPQGPLPPEAGGAAPGGELGLPPQVLQIIQQLVEMMSPEQRQAFIQQLAALPTPQARIEFIRQILLRMQQGQSGVGAAASGPPGPPPDMAAGGPPMGGPAPPVGGPPGPVVGP